MKFSEYSAETAARGDMIARALRSRTGRPMSELESVRYLAYCQSAVLGMVAQALPNGEDLIREFSAIAGELCRNKYVAEMTGSYPPPDPTTDRYFATAAEGMAWIEAHKHTILAQKNGLPSPNSHVPQGNHGYL